MLNELAKEAHENAVAHGWYEEERGLPEMLMLCVSELSEALEEYRNGNPMEWYNCGLDARCDDVAQRDCGHKPDNCPFRCSKPEGVAVEIADCVIRILDWCGHEGIDIDAIIRRKMEFNKGRPFRHGNKIC